MPEQEKTDLTAKKTPSPAEPTISDFIAKARDAEVTAAQMDAVVENAKREANEAKVAALRAWDVLYDQLYMLKVEAGDSQSFQQSKLGNLLRGMRQ